MHPTKMHSCCDLFLHDLGEHAFFAPMFLDPLPDSTESVTVLHNKNLESPVQFSSFACSFMDNLAE